MFPCLKHGREVPKTKQYSRKPKNASVEDKVNVIRAFNIQELQNIRKF